MLAYVTFYWQHRIGFIHQNKKIGKSIHTVSWNSTGKTEEMTMLRLWDSKFE